MSGSVRMFVCLHVYAPLAWPFKIKIWNLYHMIENLSKAKDYANLISSGTMRVDILVRVCSIQLLKRNHKFAAFLRFYKRFFTLIHIKDRCKIYNCYWGIPYHFTEPKTSPPQNDLKFCIQLLLHVVRIFWKFQVPHPPGSHIMAFLIFPYFWCFRVSLIQRLSIKFEYFLRPSEISHIFQLSR